MTALKGYINGNTIVAEDAVPDSFDGKEVIITILDTSRKNEKRGTKKYTDDDVKDAFGMWKNHSDSENVEEYVRNLRKGRHFDI